MVSIMGYFSLLLTLFIPIAVVFLLVSIHKIKKNSDAQVEQNKQIIQFLEERKS